MKPVFVAGKILR